MVIFIFDGALGIGYLEFGAKGLSSLACHLRQHNKAWLTALLPIASSR